ncbi:unnamed protein product [Aspergillus oryzae]|uniref:Unnamed protein product n=1 Tax=Aspergillus oryzae TaxID=5062 RepID=A0AAN5BWI8_ASPOZ|nr:unnamed protein product [Aspergillus oryzae]GMF93331.1 unnamed protein product [Aspergillus oryzae]GMG28169.1 unnamed protein product [Aspergillus oryzae]
MKAIVLNGTNATVVYSQPIPKLRDDYLLIKTVAVALNPTDCKAISQGRGAKDGLAGCDFAGIVEEIGPVVTKRWNKGDRVCGCTHGANSRNPDDGSFAEFIVVKGDVCMRMLDGMSFEEAAGIGVSAITCGQGLFQNLGLNLPLNPVQKKEYILIYGGELQLVWDTIGSDQGVHACMAALSTKPGCRYGTILLNDIPRQDVACTRSIMMTFRGEPFDLYGKHFPPSAEDFEFAKMFTQLTETLLAENKLRPHPIRVCEGGLQGVLDGVGLVQQGNVSGVKLVYRVADTP